MVDWEIHGRELTNCNCDYACPCQFNLPPTQGFCEAAGAFAIDRGHFGDVRLDGVRCAGIYAWPGPVHEGNGRMQLIVDDSASDAQRDAVIRIMSGEETEPLATMWAVYAAMCPTRLAPVFSPIELEIDVEKRIGHILIQGLFETRAEPLRNPITKALYRIRIDLPDGFEFRLAEIGSASTIAKGDIPLDLKNSYGQFAELHLCNSGVIRKPS